MKNKFLEELKSWKDAGSFLVKKEDFWMREANKKSLALFREMARAVPAYKDFLKKNKIDIAKIKSWKDLDCVPEMTKDNYLRQYPLEKLCFGGKMKGKNLVFTATSGSTGKSFYFPRDKALDWQSSLVHEYFLQNTFGGKPKNTLVIDSFGMGVWIGGIITYQAFKYLAEKGYPITIITPGVNKKEIFEAVKNLAGKFEQVILCGYPPFIKDVIDEGEILHKINWRALNMKFVFAAEAFSEQFRDYLVKKAVIGNPYLSITNIYGSADLGSMALETPICALARRLATKNSATFKKLFPCVNKTPTLAQFNPLFTNFEEKDGKILCTGYNALPLFKYSIGDHGGVMKFSELIRIFKEDGIDLRKECKKVGIEKTISEMPFVYVYERADFSVKLCGAIIYPEHVKEALAHESLECYITGKFAIAVKNDEKENQTFEVHLEMKPSAKCPKSLGEKVTRMIMEKLLEKNAEYKNNHSVAPDKMAPKVVFWDYEHENYFKPGGKQKWIAK